MNYSIIIYIIGMILEIEAVFMALPAITALIYQETSGVAFLITIALCLVIGLPLTRKKPTRKAFYTKEGFVTVALSWIVLSIIGAIPFVISRSIPNPVDALFETVSGFTTTGASILSDVEALPHCMLMWRSFTHWIGGMVYPAKPRAGLLFHFVHMFFAGTKDDIFSIFLFHVLLKHNVQPFCLFQCAAQLLKQFLVLYIYGCGRIKFIRDYAVT